MPVTMETILTMYNDCWIMIVIDVDVGHAFTAQQVAFLPIASYMNAASLLLDSGTIFDR